jgi:hypothetical protein
MLDLMPTPAQDHEEAEAAGDEPLVRSLPTWLRMHFNVGPEGDLVVRSTTPGSRSRPYAHDGARAACALISAAHRAQKRAATAEVRAAAAEGERDVIAGRCRLMASSVTHAYGQLDALEADMLHLQVRFAVLL